MNDFERLLLDHSEQMLLLVDPADLRLLAVSRVTERLLGYSREALLSKVITDIESSLQDVFYWEDVRTGQHQEIEAQEGEHFCADGSTLPVRKTVRTVELGGRALMLVQANDMRIERRIEDDLAHTLSQLRATLESTGNGILVIDWKGKIANLNRVFSNMWKIPDTVLMTGDDGATLDYVAASVIDSDGFGRRLKEVVDDKEVVDILRLRDGQVFECTSRPQYVGDDIVGRVFSFDDMTERERIEQELRESRDRFEEKVLARTADLRAANTALLAEKKRQAELIEKLAEAQAQLLQSEKMASIGQLAAGVAHEINNPVGFVNSNLGTLQRYVTDLFRVLAMYEQAEQGMEPELQSALLELKRKIDIDYMREDVSALLDESMDGLQRVKTIVQDLKSFSRLGSTEQAPADLEQGLDSTLNVVWNELKHKSEVIKEYGGLPEVPCILSQLNQVFMNLLVNAANAIETHGRITLRTGYDPGNVWVEVEDSGKGIPPENLARIFEPFFTTKPVGQGTGLGLSLSYGIVQQHGGRIEVASVVGQGSTFRVVLPRQKKADSASNSSGAETVQG